MLLNSAQILQCALDCDDFHFRTCMQRIPHKMYIYFILQHILEAK